MKNLLYFWESEISMYNANSVGWCSQSNQSTIGSHFPWFLLAEPPKVEINKMLDFSFCSSANMAFTVCIYACWGTFGIWTIKKDIHSFLEGISYVIYVRLWSKGTDWNIETGKHAISNALNKVNNTIKRCTVHIEKNKNIQKNNVETILPIISPKEQLYLMTKVFYS